MPESAPNRNTDIPHEVQLFRAQVNLGKDATARAFSSEEEAYKAAADRVAKAQQAAQEASTPPIIVAPAKPVTPVNGILWI